MHINGFVFVLSGSILGKSGCWLKCRFQAMHKPAGQPKGIYVSALPRKVSSFNDNTVEISSFFALYGVE